MNVLFLTHRLPYAPNRGDRIRAYYLLREVSRFATVSLFSLVHDDDEAARVPAMEFAASTVVARVSRTRSLARAAVALPGSTPLTHVLLDAPGSLAAIERLVEEKPPDVVLAYCSGMAKFALARPLNNRPFVLDMVDVDSMKWRQLAAERAAPIKWVYAREARTLAAFERLAVSRARATLVVNEKERDALTRDESGGQVIVVPNGVELQALAPRGPAAREPRVVFVGVMDYLPNDEGVRWFIADVWPRIRARRPDALFAVVGRNPTSALQNAARSAAGVEVVGEVDDVRSHLHGAAVSVAPLRLARGLQNKVLEALAGGLPVVVTPQVFDGLPLEARDGCLPAADADAFASAVVQLLDLLPSERRARATQARLEALSWQRQFAPLEQILRNATGPSKPAPRQQTRQ